jgi:hypothetical protein
MARGSTPKSYPIAWSGVQSEEACNHNYYDHDADDVEDIHSVLQLRREFRKEWRLDCKRLGQKHVPFVISKARPGATFRYVREYFER